MITHLQIRGYINYLYLQRHGTPAPQELLQKWTTLQDADIAIQLQNLYKSWELSTTDVVQYERNFAQAIQNTPTANTVTNSAMPPPIPAPPQPIVSNVGYQPPAVKKSSNIGLYVLLTLLATGLLIGGVWFYHQFVKKDTAIATQTIDMPAPAPAQLPSTSPVPSEAATEPPVAEPIQRSATASNSNANAIITSLLTAQQDNDFDKIYSYYSPAIEKYYTVNYPTRMELQSAYEKTFAKASNRQHTNVNIEDLGNNTFKVTGMFSYDGLNTGEHVDKGFCNYYKLNPDGQVVYEGIVAP